MNLQETARAKYGEKIERERAEAERQQQEAEAAKAAVEAPVLRQLLREKLGVEAEPTCGEIEIDGIEFRLTATTSSSYLIPPYDASSIDGKYYWLTVGNTCHECENSNEVFIDSVEDLGKWLTESKQDYCTCGQSEPIQQARVPELQATMEAVDDILTTNSDVVELLQDVVNLRNKMHNSNDAAVINEMSVRAYDLLFGKAGE